MNLLETLVTEYLQGQSFPYFFRQYAVIVCIFIFGSLITDRFEGSALSWIKRSILAFPVGLSAFVITAYAMLITQIPYNTLTVTAALVLETAAVIILNRRSYAAHTGKSEIRHMLTALIAVLVIAAIAVSGIAPVSISNDSMYFFRRYPDIIVYYGKLRDQFDFWLTDTGLGTVSIDTLCALFGFGESFGIREFFHIDFICFFAVCVYERAKSKMSVKGAYAAAFLVTLVLAASTPFVILGHWALANMYFMEMFFIAAYTAADDREEKLGICPLLLVALSLFRIEGTLFVVWLIICISLYHKSGKKLALFVIAPMVLLFGGYCLRIFVGFYVLDNVYLFLTPQKAVLLVSLMVLTGIYIAFVEPVFKKRYKKALPFVYVSALVLGNAALFVLDRQLYVGNLKAFLANLFRQSGWGMFPYFVITTLILIAAVYAVSHLKGRKIEKIIPEAYDITLTVGFLLIVIAASYGRGDILAENVGDSGNRVLLQIVPLIVLTLSSKLISLTDLREPV